MISKNKRLNKKTNAIIQLIVGNYSHTLELKKFSVLCHIGFVFFRNVTSSFKMFCMLILSREGIIVEICRHHYVSEYTQGRKEAGFPWGRFYPDSGQEEPWFMGSFQLMPCCAILLGVVSIRVKDTGPRRCSHAVCVPSPLTPEIFSMPPPWKESENPKYKPGKS